MAPRVKKAKTQKVEQEQLQKEIVKQIVVNELPFSAVEDEGFKERMEATYPGFQILSHEMIASDCVKLFMDEKLKLKSLIKRTNQRVCLTLSTWTSNQSVKYLCISAHFIDNNWELHKKIIGLSPLVSDNGEEIGRAVEKCLHDWEISNVFAISTGSASSYGVAIDYLKTRFVDSVLDGKFLHVKCIIDFINDLVKHGLNLYPNSIARVREAIRYVRQSPARVELIKECNRVYWKEFDRRVEFRDLAREYWMKSDSFLLLDCPTRWTSTYEMLAMFGDT